MTTDAAGDTSIRILHLEDSPLDAELACAVLRRESKGIAVERVSTRRAFEAALRAGGFGLILADYHVPGFDGMAALDLAKAAAPDVPFVFLSGRMGEEVAIDSLKRGATDYVLKARIERLVPAVNRALAEARDRADARAAERLLRESEAALRENDRRKDEFLAMLAHELRNPLAAIRAAADVADRAAAPGDASWGLDVIRRQVRHLTRLIDDLLDVSRITRGKIALKSEPVAVNALVDSAVASARPLIEARGHELGVSGVDGQWVLGDPVRLEQILVNLLTNAAKYTDKGGRIGLRVAGDGRMVEFAIRDDGMGIPPEQLPKMFELFAQGDRTLARSEGGLGIGLTLVKALAELHGGWVTAASDGPGRGSEFAVRIPAADPPPAGTPSRPAPAPEVAPLDILVVDDNLDMLRGMERLLGLDGHRVRAVQDGPSAIAEANAGRFDLIFLDIGLPMMDGLEVARTLRETGAAGDAKVVAVSGYGQPDDRERSRDAGFDDHLVKPVDPGFLREYLRDHGARDRPDSRRS